MLSEHNRKAIGAISKLATGAGAPLAHPVTFNFHPDAIFQDKLVVEAMADSGFIRSQFETLTSNGGLTAHPGGARWDWESKLFRGAYDEAPPTCRPKYGAVNYQHKSIGAAPRFGSCHFRLRKECVEALTFAYPESSIGPEFFGTSRSISFLNYAASNPFGLEPLDNYVEAHFHGHLKIGQHLEAVVLDPSFKGTVIEWHAQRMGISVEWHQGFSLDRFDVGQLVDYRGKETANFIFENFSSKTLTPHSLMRFRSGCVDLQTLKKAWHCLARFGSSKSQDAPKPMA